MTKERKKLLIHVKTKLEKLFLLLIMDSGV